MEANVIARLELVEDLARMALSRSGPGAEQPLAGEVVGPETNNRVVVIGGATSISVGVVPMGDAYATAGSLRMPYAGTVAVRNQGDTGNLTVLSTFGVDGVRLSDPLAAETDVVGANSVFIKVGGGNYFFAAGGVNTTGVPVVPVGDNSLNCGSNALRWSLVRGVVITSGDLDLCDEEHGAHWTVREEKDCLIAVNRMTDEAFKIPMTPLTSAERSRYLGTRPLHDKHDHAAVLAERAALAEEKPS